MRIIAVRITRIYGFTIRYERNNTKINKMLNAYLEYCATLMISPLSSFYVKIYLKLLHALCNLLYIFLIGLFINKLN